MDEVKNTKMYDTLLETSCLIYTLKMALNNPIQLKSDTSPYGKIAGIIEHKISTMLEMVVPEF